MVAVEEEEVSSTTPEEIAVVETTAVKTAVETTVVKKEVTATKTVARVVETTAAKVVETTAAKTITPETIIVDSEVAAAASTIEFTTAPACHLC